MTRNIGRKSLGNVSSNRANDQTVRSAPSIYAAAYAQGSRVLLNRVKLLLVRFQGRVSERNQATISIQLGFMKLTGWDRYF